MELFRTRTKVGNRPPPLFFFTAPLGSKFKRREEKEKRPSCLTAIHTIRLVYVRVLERERERERERKGMVGFCRRPSIPPSFLYYQSDRCLHLQHLRKEKYGVRGGKERERDGIFKFRVCSLCLWVSKHG